MASDEGLRERKKRRTRQALIEAGLRLFEDQGYEQTTVAQIAAAADVSTATFFNYFPSKDALIFADSEERIAATARLVLERAPDDSITTVLRRAADAWLRDWDTEIRAGTSASRVRLLLSVPALRAVMFDRIFSGQEVLADAFARAFPDQLTPADARAVVGAFTGAQIAVGFPAIRSGVDDEQRHEQAKAAIRRATDIVLAGLGSFDGADDHEA